MNTDTLNKLEFNKIKSILSTYCKTYIGKNLSLKLEPSNKKEAVETLLSQTQEALILIYKNSTPPFCEISNISVYLKTLEQGSFLSAKALLEIATILKLSQQLKNYFYKDFIKQEDFPILNTLFNNLYTNKNITEQIFNCIIDENTIDDKSSVGLQTIRKKQRKLEQDIRYKLNEMIHSNKYSKYIQENIVTIRNDRFVIPVKEEYRLQIKGFVHDISNAGSTLFIEPINIFELNNEINQLKIEEELEIEKILQHLSNLLIPYITELSANTEIIGTLDFIFAKAIYARSIDGIIPQLSSNKEIELIKAKHPLLDKENAVPISLSLGINFSTLLITGPNTGGKTVTLKTVGLLTCMACSGLAISANENSKIYVFENIFADIGDNQSISDSLSTFSSHLLNIIDITKNANNNSLILVDELGSGTDPIEGANLAISILDNFEEIGALTIATTHYQELKKYALTKDSFENASVEFDINTLSPTYRLLIGIPGKSNAFEISKKLGLSDHIINNAKKMMNSEDIKFEELLKSVYDDKSQLEKEKEIISKKLLEISSLQKSLETDLSKLKEKEYSLINDAKIKAREILINAKDEANSIIKNMHSFSNNKDLEHLRNDLNQKIKKLDIINIGKQYQNQTNSNSLRVEDVQPNLEVFITNLQKNGTIISNISKSNEVQVLVENNFKMNINLKYLEIAKNTKNKQSSPDFTISKYTHISKSKNIKSEINIIGLNIDEARFVVDKFIDDCSLAKLKNIRIIHGKGTGKLRNGIHQFLKTNPHVKSFRIGTYGEGEMGVTIVELK